MAKALGVGGIFFKSPDPDKLCQWYAQWLGLSVESESGSFVLFFPRSMPSKWLHGLEPICVHYHLLFTLR